MKRLSAKFKKRLKPDIDFDDNVIAVLMNNVIASKSLELSKTWDDVVLSILSGDTACLQKAVQM